MMIQLITKADAIEKYKDNGVTRKFWERYIAGKIPKYGKRFDVEDIEIRLEQIKQEERKKVGFKIEEEKCSIETKSQKSDTIRRMPAGTSMRTILAKESKKGISTSKH